MKLLEAGTIELNHIVEENMGAILLVASPLVVLLLTHQLVEDLQTIFRADGNFLALGQVLEIHQTQDIMFLKLVMDFNMPPVDHLDLLRHLEELAVLVERGKDINGHLQQETQEHLEIR